MFASYWIHEIKHNGFRLLARRGASGVRLFTRNGHAWTEPFPLSCLIDGVTCNDTGLTEFEGLRGP
jgi:ATP-dependent DNA ligase